jgi:hypothetical protein
LGFSNWPVFLLHQLATIKFSGTIITEPSGIGVKRLQLMLFHLQKDR